MEREEAIYNISVATGVPEDIVERRTNAAYEIHSLPIVNIHNYNEIPIGKPTRKSYVSPYAKFDRIRRKRNEILWI